MNPFMHHFQRSKHLCVYQYRSSILPTTLFFPYVTKLTLIDCSPSGISQILYPHRFPKLEQIHYLSGHPGTYSIHERFPSVQWVFPNRDYAFYNCMLEAGHGSKSDTIITEHIYGKKIANHVTSFDIHIPGYGRRNGLFYQSHMNNYFNHPAVLSSLPEHELLPICEKENSHYLDYLNNHKHSAFHRYERHCIEQDVMNHILKDA